MIDLLNDLSTITNIGKFNYHKLVDNINTIIGHSIIEALKEGKDNVIIDLGIGELNASNLNSNITYEFKPSINLDKLITKSIKNNESPLA